MGLESPGVALTMLALTGPPMPGSLKQDSTKCPIETIENLSLLLFARQMPQNKIVIDGLKKHV